MRPTRSTRGVPLAAVLCAVILAPWSAARAQLPGLPGDPSSLMRMDGGMLRAGDNSDIVTFGIASSVPLTQITASEILGSGNQASDEGTAIASGWNAALSQGAIAGSAPNTAIQRNYSVIWAAWVHRRSVASLDVQYELLGPDGSSGQLVSQDDNSSRIAVTAAGTGPFLYAAAGRYRLVYGGGVFNCDLSGAEIAGRYEGQLIVTLSVL